MFKNSDIKIDNLKNSEKQANDSEIRMKWVIMFVLGLLKLIKE